MVNNSININKTKESLNSDGQQFYQYQQNKESLNSDGQQFHQYQQNKESLNSDGQQFYQYQQKELSPLILTHWTQKGQRCMMLEILLLVWKTQKYGGVKPVNEIPIPPLDHWFSNGNTYTS